MPAGSPRYKVLLTPGAEQDLESIHDYIAEFDHPANAEHVLDELMKVVQRLARFPSAGATRRNSPRWASRTTARLRSRRTG